VSPVNNSKALVNSSHKKTAGNRNGRRTRVGFLISYSGTNLGDAAIQGAILENLRKRFEAVDFYGINLCPKEVEKRHGIPGFPITGLSVDFYSSYDTLFGEYESMPAQQQANGAQHGTIDKIKEGVKKIPLLAGGCRFVLRRLGQARNITREIRHLLPSYFFLRNLDLVVVSGSGQLMELWGGPWGHPYALFRWSLMAKLTKTKFVVTSVGMTGLLQTSLTKYFIRTALSTASYRSYRDQGTKQLLKDWEFTSDDPCVPDLAFSLDLSRYAPDNSADVRERPSRVVAISPVSFGYPGRWPWQDLVTYNQYLDTLAEFTYWLIQRGYRILLFVSTRADRGALDELKVRMGERYGRDILIHLAEPSISSFEDILSQVNKVDFVVATRFHGVVLSHVLSKPVIAISYDRKVDAHMKDVEQNRYNLNILHVDFRQLCESFVLLETNATQVRGHINKCINAFRVKLDNQYERLVRYATSPKSHSVS
jgi:polysaccharide pyruvyl transferase WcaK-like protein